MVMKKTYSAPYTKVLGIMPGCLLDGFSIANTTEGPKVVSDETVDPSTALSKKNSVWDEEGE